MRQSSEIRPNDGARLRPRKQTSITAVTGVLLLIMLVTAPAAVAEGGGKIDVQLASAKEIKHLHDPAGKARLVNFWATWCGPCKEEFPQLVALYHRYEPKGLEFVTVSADQKDNRDAVVKFLQKNDASGTNLLFSGRDTAGMLESFDGKWKEILPFTVLFDAKGKVVFRREGQIKEADLEKALEKLLGPSAGS